MFSLNRSLSLIFPTYPKYISPDLGVKKLQLGLAVTEGGCVLPFVWVCEPVMAEVSHLVSWVTKAFLSAKSPLVCVSRTLYKMA